MFTEFILVKAVGRYFFNYIMFFGQGEEGGKNCGEDKRDDNRIPNKSVLYGSFCVSIIIRYLYFSEIPLAIGQIPV